MSGGPLLNTLSNVKGSPKWSFKGKPADGHKIDTPGPGSYASSESSKYSKSPSHGFGGAPRDSNNKNAQPGPGQYQPEDPNNTSSKYGFGTSNRKGAPRRQDQPGPGSYNLGDTVGSGPGYSVAGRRETKSDSHTPGPGAYQPAAEGCDKKSPQWGFGTADREVKVNGISPGPGAYRADAKKEGPQYSFRGRSEAARINSTPGPGAHGAPYSQFG